MLHLCASPQDQIARLTQAVATALAADFAQNGRALLAVSGGRSPIPLFHALAQAPIDWARVTIALVDERVVPADHADSNAALVRAHLLTGAAAQARFLPLVDDPQDLAGCVTRANAQLRALALPISAALLGMGDDGHTASLFPGAPELAAGLDPAYPDAYLAITPPPGRPKAGIPLPASPTRGGGEITPSPLVGRVGAGIVLSGLSARKGSAGEAEAWGPNTPPPPIPHNRISLSLAALLQSRRLLLSIAGEAKRAVFEQASAPPRSAQLPISFVIQQTQTPFDAYWTR
ncbi:MAG: 6-phosphogluconolactonase [Thiomonas sp.]|nr:6-phosphogluconolactonase [Thiomonas sp.]